MPSDCPYHFYRTSTDITNTFASMHANLLSTMPFQRLLQPLSRPGAWAYVEERVALLLHYRIFSVPLVAKVLTWCTQKKSVHYRTFSVATSHIRTEI